MRNKRVILQSRPAGAASASNFIVTEEERPELAPGCVRLKQVYLSPDPYMRSRMEGFEDSYIPPFKLHEPVNGYAIARVDASANASYQAGEYVTGLLNWEEYSLLDAAALSHPALQLRKIDPSLCPLSYHLGILGMPGMTAWTGLSHIAQPKEGETVFVSAASGAVGSIVGQIAKNSGCQAVGCAGSDEKVEYLRQELGFDAAFNYKTVANIDQALKACCPDGIDVNFENVGGPVMHAVYKQMNQHGRFIMCGMIADYDPPELNSGPPLMATIVKSLTIQGFIVSDYKEACRQWLEIGSQWLQEGKLSYRESLTEGIENAASALLGLLKGENSGKAIVKLEAEETR